MATELTNEFLNALNTLRQNMWQVNNLRDEVTKQEHEVLMLSRQLEEIRALLRLPADASHEETIEALFEIGKTDRRVDTNAIPERYYECSWSWSMCGTRG